MTPTAALIAFGLLTMMLITIEIIYAYSTQGFAYGFSSNRPDVTRTAFGKRVERVYKNQVEAAAYIVPVLAGAAILGLSGTGVAIASLLIILGRVAFAVLYFTGLPFLRVLGFSTTSLSTFYLAAVSGMAVL